MDDDIINEIKVLIIQALELEEVTPDDIDADAPLFNEGLGLDSIDALELGVALQKRFDVKIDPNAEDIQKWFYSVRSLSEFLQKSQAA